MASLDDNYKKPVQDIPADLVRALKLVALEGKGILDVDKEKDKERLPHGIVLAGSAGSTLFPFFGDVDGIQAIQVESAACAAAALQRVVRRVRDTPGFAFKELKAGRNENGVLLPERCWIENGKVQRWDWAFTDAHLRRAVSLELVTPRAEREWRGEIGCTDPPDLVDFVHFDDTLDAWKVRWSAADILRGKKALEQKYTPVLSLADALLQPALVKLDVVFWSTSEERFLDLSMIYALTCGGKPLNGFPSISPPSELSLKQNAYSCSVFHNYVKLTKRLLSLAVLLGKTDDVELLRDMIASQTGRMALVAADCTTLREAIDVFEPVPITKIRDEIRAIKARAATFYGLPEQAHSVIGLWCTEAVRAPDTPRGWATMQMWLEKVQTEMAVYAESAAGHNLHAHHYMTKHTLVKWAMP